MKAEKSLSPRLSRRSISVAGSADHSVIAFMRMVWAYSSVSWHALWRVPAVVFGCNSIDFNKTP